jgi:excisionase family DNA binding protein
MATTNKELLSTPEICRLLKTNRNTIAKLIKEGLPCYSFGNRHRFDEKEVLAYLKKGKKK